MVSPILSNIYLDRLDKFVEQVLIPQYTRGKRRAAQSRILQADKRSGGARGKRGDRAAGAATAHSSSARSRSGTRWTPATGGCDTCRYADDHLLGFTGPRAEAEEIKQRLAGFLRETSGWN